MPVLLALVDTGTNRRLMASGFLKTLILADCELLSSAKLLIQSVIQRAILRRTIHDGVGLLPLGHEGLEGASAREPLPRVEPTKHLPKSYNTPNDANDLNGHFKSRQCTYYHAVLATTLIPTFIFCVPSYIGLR